MKTSTKLYRRAKVTLKRTFLFTFLIFPFLSSVFSQELFTGIESEVSFFSEAPMENIESNNSGSKILFNASTNDLAVVIPIKHFKFKNPLMEEHFNENYLESDKYPRATFKARINQKVELRDAGTQEVTATGTLTVHGVEQERTIPGIITFKDNQIIFQAKFQIRLEDHQITIPTLLFQNIAEIVDVNCRFILQPKKLEKD